MGTVRLRRHHERRQGLIEVAKEAKQQRRAAREGHVVLLAPAFATGCSVGGVSYPVVDGTVEVPTHQAAALESHGFRRVDADA